MKRRLVIAGVVLVALLTGGLVAAWLEVSSRLLAGVDRWAEERRQEGWQVQWSERERSGFPLAVTGLFQEPRLEDPKGWRWEGEALAATIELTDWNRVELEGFGLQRFFWPAMPPAKGPAELEALEKRAVLTYDERGQPATLALRARDAEAAYDGRRVSAQTLEADVTAPKDAARYDVPVDGQGRLRATGVTLPEGMDPLLGQTVTLLELAGVLTGQLPKDGALDNAALRAWAESGGILDLDQLSLDWGPLTLRGDGSITLDEQDRPLGAFSLRVKGLPETVERLARRGQIDSGVAFTVQAVALSIGKTDPSDGRREISLPLTLQDGWLSIGPPIGPMPLVRLDPVDLGR